MREWRRERLLDDSDIFITYVNSSFPTRGSIFDGCLRVRCCRSGHSNLPDFKFNNIVILGMRFVVVFFSVDRFTRFGLSPRGHKCIFPATRSMNLHNCTWVRDGALRASHIFHPWENMKTSEYDRRVDWFVINLIYTQHRISAAAAYELLTRWMCSSIFFSSSVNVCSRFTVQHSLIGKVEEHRNFELNVQICAVYCNLKFVIGWEKARARSHSARRVDAVL